MPGPPLFPGVLSYNFVGTTYHFVSFAVIAQAGRTDYNP